MMMMMAVLPQLSMNYGEPPFFLIIAFINLQFPEFRSKSLSALCRMVLKPTDYSTSFADVDLDSFNINKTKTKVKKVMDDVDYAIKYATGIIITYGLDIQACHDVDEEYESDKSDERVYPADFLFLGDNWMDPGPEVEL